MDLRHIVASPISYGTDSAMTGTTERADIRLCGLATGTRLLTSRGLLPIETIGPGERVEVLLRGERRLAGVIWSGRRDVILSSRGRSAYPVRIRRNAIANGVPGRDVYLAADHAIFLDRKLFKAGDLVNGASILIDQGRKSVTYRAIMLEQHNVVLADQLPVETLLPVNADSFVESAGSRVSSQEDSPVPPDGPPDVAIEVAYILAILRDALAEHGVRLELALQPGLRCRIQKPAFHSLLNGLIRYGIEKAPGRRLLIVGAGQGERVSIAMTLDGAPDDVRTVQANIRTIEEVAALQSASTSVHVTPGVSTTVYLKIMSG